MERWWVRHPAALDAEKAALHAWGQPWHLEAAEFDRGRLVVKVQVHIAGAPRELTALYPDSFPYFAPQVRLTEVRLPRHHNPQGYLCLLADDGADWRPGIDTLAGILQTQLPRLVSAGDLGADPDLVAQIEEHAGEPLSNFLQYIEFAGLLVPDEVPPTDVVGGKLEVLAEKLEAGVAGCLHRVMGPAGQVYATFPSRLPSWNEKIPGYWVRLPHRPTLEGETSDAWREQFFKLARDKVKEFANRLDSAKAGQTFVFGFIYPDEVSWRQSQQDWLLLWVIVKRARKGSRAPEAGYGFLRADPGGDAALSLRSPELSVLRGKRVLLVGLGAIGSPVAVQLAKAGVGHLDLIDADNLQAGNAVRWALGWRKAGWPKSLALASFLANEFPRTRVEPRSFRIGDRVDDVDGTPIGDYDVLRELTSKADLVIDATANFLVNRLVTDIARRESKPYLWLSTTPGAAGGVVGRVIPGKTQGCWHCFQRHLTDRSLPVPADSGVANVQPAGCTHPTFVASGVDSDEVAVLAARLAVATLARGSPQGRDFPWDVAIGDLSQGQHRIAGRWEGHELNKHATCHLCASEDN